MAHVPHMRPESAVTTLYLESGLVTVRQLIADELHALEDAFPTSDASRIADRIVEIVRMAIVTRPPLASTEDALDFAARLALADVEQLLELADPGGRWSVQVVARALLEVEARAGYRKMLDRSVYGRARRGRFQ